MTTTPLRSLLTAPLLLVGLAACQTASDVTPRPIPGDVLRVAIKAVLRSVVADNGAALRDGSVASCIGIGQRPALLGLVRPVCSAGDAVGVPTSTR